MPVFQNHLLRQNYQATAKQLSEKFTQLHFLLLGIQGNTGNGPLLRWCRTYETSFPTFVAGEKNRLGPYSQSLFQKETVLHDESRIHFYAQNCYWLAEHNFGCNLKRKMSGLSRSFATQYFSGQQISFDNFSVPTFKH